MDCFISGFLPTPVAVHDGGMRAVTVTITAMDVIEGAALEIENLQPQGADVILNGSSADLVSAPLPVLPAGQSFHTVELGLRLQETNALSGAIIGLCARVIQVEDGVHISPDYSFLGVIGASGVT